MAYQQFYGNPYSPGVASGVMEGAKERTEFARGVQRARLRAEQRRMSLAEAQFEWRKDEAQIEREREQRRFETTLQQKQKLLQNQRRREQVRQKQFEQQHKLRRDKFDLDVRQVETQQQLREEAMRQQAELDKLKAAGEIEDAIAEQRQAEIDAKKTRGDQMIRTLQAGAVPVDNDYQLGEGEVDFVNPLTEQRFVLRKPIGGDAVKYNEYEEQNLRVLKDQSEALQSTIDTYRERAEDLEAQVAQDELHGGFEEKVKAQRAQAKQYRKELEEAQKELKAVNLRRANLLESRNPEGAPVDSKYEMTSTGTQEFGARTPWEVVNSYVRAAENKGQTTTPEAVIQYLVKQGYLSPASGNQ